MTQIVRYFEDFETEERRKEAYSEGPFVIVHASGWRIEVESPSGKCPNTCHPILPDPSIYSLRNLLGYPVGKFNKQEDAAKLCDHLNKLVKEGTIIKAENGMWHAPQFEKKTY